MEKKKCLSLAKGSNQLGIYRIIIACDHIAKWSLLTKAIERPASVRRRVVWRLSSVLLRVLVMVRVHFDCGEGELRGEADERKEGERERVRGKRWTGEKRT